MDWKSSGNIFLFYLQDKVSCPLFTEVEVSFSLRRKRINVVVEKPGQTNNLKMFCMTLGTSVEFQALLAEIKQKDKQREELLMNLKVCF